MNRDLQHCVLEYGNGLCQTHTPKKRLDISCGCSASPGQQVDGNGLPTPGARGVAPRTHSPGGGANPGPAPPGAPRRSGAKAGPAAAIDGRSRGWRAGLGANRAVAAAAGCRCSSSPSRGSAPGPAANAGGALCAAAAPGKGGQRKKPRAPADRCRAAGSTPAAGKAVAAGDPAAGAAGSANGPVANGRLGRQGPARPPGPAAAGLGNGHLRRGGAHFPALASGRPGRPAAVGATAATRAPTVGQDLPPGG